MSESSVGQSPSLVEAERRVLDALSIRQVADFSSLPTAQRQLRAEFLQALISNTHESEAALCCPLRIRGAHIVGPLQPPSGLAQSGTTALQFLACNFDSPVDLSGAEFLVLRLNDCSLPAFIGASMRVRADLDLSGSQFSGVNDYESELSQVGGSDLADANASPSR
jgi:uncharacterized protein YjbI with pentapeptide repeats